MSNTPSLTPVYYTTNGGTYDDMDKLPIRVGILQRVIQGIRIPVKILRKIR